MASTFKHLQAFVHVSTAFVNGNLPKGSRVLEHVYPLDRQAGSRAKPAEALKLPGASPDELAASLARLPAETAQNQVRTAMLMPAACSSCWPLLHSSACKTSAHAVAMWRQCSRPLSRADANSRCWRQKQRTCGRGPFKHPAMTAGHRAAAGLALPQHLLPLQEPRRAHGPAAPQPQPASGCRAPLHHWRPDGETLPRVLRQRCRSHRGCTCYCFRWAVVDRMLV